MCIEHHISQQTLVAWHLRLKPGRYKERRLTWAPALPVRHADSHECGLKVLASNRQRAERARLSFINNHLENARQA